MKQEHDDETYPPRVVMSAHDQGSALKLGIFFYNVREEDNLNMEHTLYPSMLLHYCTCQLYSYCIIKPTKYCCLFRCSC